MYIVEVTPQDVVASRFAISPLIETMHAQWVLHGHLRAGAHLRWAERWREPYREVERRHPVLRAAVAISGNLGSGNVDFIAPPPAGINVPFERELELMRATPVRQAHEEIDRALAGRQVARDLRETLYRDDIVTLLADAFEELWTEIVSLSWPRLRAILERDVVQRAGQLATYGWAAALDDLSDRVAWRSDGRWGHLEVRLSSNVDERHRLGGKGLLFLPSAFAQGTGIFLDDAWPYGLIYPARGIAAAPDASTAPLSTLIGRTRSRLLTELASPATTTHLASLFDLSLGTTSGHLTALRKTGLVTATRTGRRVLYTRTPLGDALLDGKL
ncbi:winged helix-turn-helix domain-containing protein [Nonomuraea sp. NBC_01738]|uniref:ArsR/SmtB family transcription factor n=1 Tax=Nonomuraea sp. NBC_01738 TaxID=2976003 RepID=UPI002E15D038|nr:winged helix-turn-helix domain-containing protein [Nonomuraea sp. NBC_01738]